MLVTMVATVGYWPKKSVIHLLGLCDVPWFCWGMPEFDMIFHGAFVGKLTIAKRWGFPKSWYPKMNGFYRGKSKKKVDDWGYPQFRKPPNLCNGRQGIQQIRQKSVTFEFGKSVGMLPDANGHVWNLNGDN